MGFFPESGPNRSDISCDDCSAACCRAGMGITLSKTEVVLNSLKIKRKVVIPAEPNERSFTVHEPDSYPEPFTAVIPANIEVSTLVEDCGHLDGNRCLIYDSPTRPEACDVMEVGSDECLNARKVAGFVD